MQIYVLDADPRKAAEYHCDAHIPKMLLEAAHIASSVIHVLDAGEVRAEYDQASGRLRPWWAGANIYGPGIGKDCEHPCFKWLLESHANMQWLLELADGLNSEMEIRWHHPSYAPHGITSHIKRNLDKIWAPTWKASGCTPFMFPLPPKIVNLGLDAVTSYRLYYASDKRNIADWKRRGTTPPWWGASCQAADIMINPRRNGAPQGP